MEAIGTRVRRFSVTEYYALGEAGILKPDQRVELIRGRIWEMSPVGHQHAWVVRNLTRLFYELAGPEVEIAVQDPLRIGYWSEPVPDIQLLKPLNTYAARHPVPEDVMLVVEVSDTTLRFDRTVKVPLYAKAGIPEMWIVSIPERCVYVYRDPASNQYEASSQIRTGDTLTIAALPQVGAIAVSDLMPPE